jgi:hypothetical protein
MPHLGGSSKNKKKDGYRKAKREVYHAVLERLFASVKKNQDEGGFTATRVFPFIHFLLQFLLHLMSALCAVSLQSGGAGGAGTFLARSCHNDQ